IAGAQLIQVQQDPVDLIVSPGSSLKVFCSITGHSNPDLYWYQWTPEAGFTLVFTSVGKGSVNPSEKDRFKSSRPDNLQIVLESDGVGERDSAVWYCAASPHSVPEQLLSCTKTTPTSVGALAQKKKTVLESDGVGERDSAVWYCAASPHSVPEQLLSCTKTTLTSVAALLKGSQTFKYHCIVTDFSLWNLHCDILIYGLNHIMSC
ncbi:hypothetical protein AMEX_G17847, partial [Astyanax mexicanus]